MYKMGEGQKWCQVPAKNDVQAKEYMEKMTKKPKGETKMEFKTGDRVEHARRGKGTFFMYGTFHDESIVEFDKDSDAEGETLTVTTGLLRKISENQ